MKITSACLKNLIGHANLPGPPDGDFYQLACVFLILFERPEPHLLAIQKSDNEGYPWRNQVALPGGHIDEFDAGPEEAVFRELEEELSIHRKHIEFIGSMGHFETIHYKDIEVFIGLWNGKGAIRHDTEEIARVLEIPVKELLRIHHLKNFHGREPNIRDLRYPYQDVVIWGVTAKILHFFIELLYPFWNETFALMKGRRI